VRDGLIGSVHMYLDRQTLRDMLGMTAAPTEPHLNSYAAGDKGGLIAIETSRGSAPSRPGGT
jgi:hypothetical protein